VVEGLEDVKDFFAGLRPAPRKVEEAS